MIYNKKMFIASIFSLLILLYLVANIFLFVFQRSLLYHPAKGYLLPSDYGLDKMELVDFKTNDGVKLKSWLFKTDSEKVILYLHGNAGNLSDRAIKFNKFSTLGHSMLMLSWRGYGESEGSPSEEGLYEDARAAIKYLETIGYSENSIIIYGESLGTGVATKMATQFTIDRLILEAPYTSITNRAAQLYPYFPVRLLLRDKFSSIDRVQNITVPILFFHGENDETMPASNSQELYDKANEPKKLVIYENVGHTDFDLDELYKLIKGFIDEPNKII